VRIGLLVRRLNQLPHVEGIARAAQGKHEVILYCDYRDLGGPKDELVPRLGRLPDRWLALAEARTTWPQSGEVDALIVPGAIGYPADELPIQGIRCCALQTSWSDLMHWQAEPAWHRIYAWSLWWGREYCLRRNLSPRPRLENWRFVGPPIAEHLRWIDPAKVRQEFGLPSGRPVVVYLPLPFGAHAGQTLRLRYWHRYSPTGDRAVVRAVRRFCDSYGALLAVKSRAKTSVPDYLRKAADLVIERDRPGEPDLLRLLTCATLMIHYNSMAVVEAAVARVPAPCIRFPAAWWPAYPDDRGGLFSPSVPVCRASRWLSDTSAHIDGVSHNYRTLYLGWTELGEQSGQRIVSDLIDSCQGGGGA